MAPLDVVELQPRGADVADRRVNVVDLGGRVGVGVNGQLRLFGARGVPPEGYSWTALSRSAGPSAYQVQDAHRNPDDSPDKIGAPVARGGELTLKLEHDVTKGANPWKTGDWIVVGTTNFSPFESEFVQIDHVSADEQGSQIVLNAATPLRHYHFGGPDPGPAHDIGSTPGTASRSFHLSQSHNFGVDERAEVGLISRNIRLTAATPKIAAPGDKALHWGGEMRFCKGYDEVSVQGVELEKFGKENLGGYPLHFHLANAAPWTPGTLPTPPTGRHLIDANSIIELAIIIAVVLWLLGFIRGRGSTI